MNPYRDVFYQRQAQWHRYGTPESVREQHRMRAKYYEWYTRGWLPPDREARVLDVGCGSGQFLHFLEGEGYKHLVGIDLDRQQIEIAKALGHNVHCSKASDYINSNADEYDLICMLDIIEHFTREELFPLMDTIVSRLKVGGRLIASVPNAESPAGLPCYFADITHEMAYTVGSFEEMLFCHGLKVVAARDPWPAPIDFKRLAYRGVSTTARQIARLGYRILGLAPPRIWSNVFWCVAENQNHKRSTKS